MHFGWITAINWIEFFAVFTAYSGTYLCNFQTRFNYPINVVSTALFSILFWKTGLFALATFNGYLVFSLLYGYIRWGNDANSRPVTTVPLKHYGFYLAFGLFVTVLFLGATWVFNPTVSFMAAISVLNPIDVIVAALSGVAQILLDNKKLENWVVWLVVDIISIPYLFMTGLPVTAVQYLIFTGNVFWGWYEWRKTMKPAELTSHEIFEDMFANLMKKIEEDNGTQSPEIN
jgi:nicotinamide mononucleotide transporter